MPDDQFKIQFRSHPSEEDWEAFAMGSIAPARVEELEEHLLGCPDCQATLERVDDFVQTMRSAASYIPQQKKPRAWLPAWFRPQAVGLVLAVGFTLVCVALAAVWRPNSWQPDRPAGPVAYVALAANRDAESSTAPSARPLELQLSRPDLSAQSYSAEVVTADGQVAWTGSAILDQGRLRSTLPKGLERGAYWVRLFGEGHALILEAGLKVQ